MILAIIPFYSGINALYTADEQLKSDQLNDYLRQTVDSLVDQVDRIVIGVCQTVDEQHCVYHGYESFFVDVDDPMHLPTALLNQLSRIEGLPEHIYYTEADQVFHGDMAALTQDLTDTRLLIPHRWEKVYEQQGLNRGILRTQDGEQYVVVNTNPEIPTGFQFYNCRSNYERYGGAFLARSRLLKRTEFIPGPSLILEGASFAIIHKTLVDGGMVMKTTDVSEFYVDHLSGYDRHKFAYLNRNRHVSNRS